MCSAITSSVLSESSAAPVTLPPAASTARRVAKPSAVSASPGSATGTPGGYGHSSAALRRPTAASAGTLPRSGAASRVHSGSAPKLRANSARPSGSQLRVTLRCGSRQACWPRHGSCCTPKQAPRRKERGGSLDTARARAPGRQAAALLADSAAQHAHGAHAPCRHPSGVAAWRHGTKHSALALRCPGGRARTAPQRRRRPLAGSCRLAWPASALLRRSQTARLA